VCDRLEDDRIRGAVNAANSAPITLAQADHIRLPAQRRGRRMRRKWCRGESVRLVEQRFALPPWHPSESLRRGSCDDQLDVTIVAAGNWSVNDNCL
jgi:hypothetical protein